MTNSAIPHIAKIYTQTLIMLAEDKADKNISSSKISQELQIIKHILNEFPQWQGMLNNPSILLQQRQDFLRKSLKACKISNVVINWMLVILKNKRINILQEIIIDFKNQMLAIKGEQIIDIESSAKVDKTQSKDIMDMCKKEISANLQFRWHHKPELLSGIRIIIGHKVQDLSLAGDLLRLRRELNFTR